MWTAAKVEVTPDKVVITSHDGTELSVAWSGSDAEAAVARAEEIWKRRSEAAFRSAVRDLFA